MRSILITPLDPVIARDGRPFNAGTRMKGLDWPYPSVLAGSLRTLLG
jgi:CRISPR-associated protein Cmr3